MSKHKVTRREFVHTSAAAAAAAGLSAGMAAPDARAADTGKILNHNANMEYRDWGKTGLKVSAVCLGGHWKRVDKVAPSCGSGKGWLSFNIDDPAFQKNRHDVVSKCIEVGINYIDACTIQEVKAYSKALEGRRDKMYVGCSWYQKEVRKAEYRSTEKLMETLEWGLQDSGIEYADVWRITMLSDSGKHTEAEVEQMMRALEKAKQQGKVRFTGLSSHDRPHIKKMIETYPEIVQSVCTPYTAKTKEMPEDSLFEAIRKYKVGLFGIKPFTSGSLFQGDSSPDHAEADADDRRARLAIRYILCNPTITAPIPGMITPQQVENAAKAAAERRELDAAETAELEQAMDEAWANLPPDYQWLKNWEYV